MRKVITYGTFDLLHKGHVNILRRAKEQGDHLTVVLSSDEFNALKGKKAYTSYEDRKFILEAIRYVDQVIPETTWEQKISDVVDNEIDIFVMGHDWEGKFDFLKEYCEVLYLPRTEGISTTKIKEDLKEELKLESK
ncbi:glycerol-3-phosphate cytidylyltransferase [Vagococcus intermedius]|uniref:Glycerol-3-phosphate cytidylyltransferase n=1 Tax=Vagococcus intermedius TaxID=2991418 RepID=A0AAF0I7Y8_9ENTE|nr:glycerol-3-phosphate cytidylyltransferase [Vagococcus intermedius]WEG73785.1 glycerol-3-phosphate cytidylyltransferase [Vagococcus intermedius]WEG75870.1 glycerol-3-phosphate cytidylyltransferase [Vagococcus intermedius]